MNFIEEMRAKLEKKDFLTDEEFEAFVNQVFNVDDVLAYVKAYIGPNFAYGANRVRCPMRSPIYQSARTLIDQVFSVKLRSYLDYKDLTKHPLTEERFKPMFQDTISQVCARLVEEVPGLRFEHLPSGIYTDFYLEQ